MKSRKQVSIAALCLLSATIITISLKARPSAVSAATAVHVSRAMMAARPVAHLANAKLRAAAIRNAMLLDYDAAPQRDSVTVQRNSSSNPPPVENLIQTLSPFTSTAHWRPWRP